MNKPSIGGARYFATFIDDKTRYVSVCFLKTRDEIFDKFKQFKVFAETQTGMKIKSIRSDNGREYVSEKFCSFLVSNGIKRQLTVPYTPQQNGGAERANRTLVEMARSMLVHASVDEMFWAEAINTAAYLRNRSETSTLPAVTPYEAWSGKKPSVSHLRVFGARAIVLDKTHRKKFKPKGVEYMLVGYSETAKAYRLHNLEKQTIIDARDVIFLEDDLVKHGSKGAANVADVKLAELQDQSACDAVDLQFDDFVADKVNPAREAVATEESHDNETEGVAEETDDNNQESRKRGPGRPKNLYTGRPGRPRKQYNVVNVIAADDIQVPNTVSEALGTAQAKEWRDSMQKEIDSLRVNNTWSLEELPKGEKLIGCKWVFSVKRDHLGKVERFKSRLVAKGCAQRFGINYNETFSPVARYSSIRMVIALSVEYKMYMHQMDVASAFLNSELTDVVYVKQPEGFVDKSYPEHVLKLHKSLYGLKQSGRIWNEKLDEVLQGFGFVPCVSEPCIYTRKVRNNFTIIVVYVDDLIVASSNKQELNNVKALVSGAFDVVDGGVLKHFLGMEIERDGELGSIHIGHKQFIESLLNDYGMQNCKANALPLEAGFQVKCNEESCQRVNQKAYQSLIGSLMYLAMTTRPDILHSVTKLAQRNVDPHKEHEVGAKRILRYLKGTTELKLHYQSNGQPIHGYVDADWAGDSSDRKSFSDWSFFAAGAAFAWESKKQSVVALSTTEAEYVALSSAAKEASYITKLVNEMGFGDVPAVKIYSDNQSALSLAKNSKFHARSKHIDIRHHHIRDLYKNKKIEIEYVPTESMISDVLTKNLCKVKHFKFVSMMGLH